MTLGQYISHNLRKATNCVMFDLCEHYFRHCTRTHLFTTKQPISFPQFQNLKQIKEMQHKKDSGEWRSLRPQDLQQQESSLRTHGAIARFFNVMSNESMNILSFITSGALFFFLLFFFFFSSDNTKFTKTSRGCLVKGKSKKNCHKKKMCPPRPRS